jgi:hypothetical protein
MRQSSNKPALKDFFFQKSTNKEFICKKLPGNYKRQTLEAVIIGTWT